MATELTPRDRMMEDWLEPVGTKAWQRKNHTFFVSSDPETQRRMVLPKLGPKFTRLPLPNYILESTGGYRDKNGRPSKFVATTRLFCAEYTLRKKLEMHPLIFYKFSANTELLSYKRQQERSYLESVNRALSFIEQQKLDTRGEAKEVYKRLEDISFGLLANIATRPYLLGARKAVENFGCINLPEGTIAEKIANGRKEKKKKIPTVAEHLNCYDFEQAKILIDQSRLMLEKILDIHKDYRKVKLSKKSKNKSKE